MLITLAVFAVCLAPPVDGPIVAGFAPSGQYAGHWGIDFGIPRGTAVRSPVDGRVTFAGSVAGMRTVTVELVPGLKVSVSYLERIDVNRNEIVRVGQPLGLSGVAHGVPAVHLSTRISGTYVDPRPRLGCAATDITRALRLLPPPLRPPYPHSRAHRHTRRDLRPDPHRPPPRW